jgi:uncharacterized membrane protein
VNVATFENVLDRWYCFLDSVYVSPDENQDWKELLPWPFKSWIESKCYHLHSNKRGIWKSTDCLHGLLATVGVLSRREDNRVISK